jgi:hypothetical protein
MADANSAKSGIFSLEHTTGHRIYFELINCFDDAKAIFMGDVFYNLSALCLMLTE